MSLFFVRHKHDAETCPAKDPQKGDMLLSHISQTNAEKLGINLKSEAVLDDQHTFVLILEADKRRQVDQFMMPFRQAGPVEIWSASTCEVVVDRAGC